MEITAPELLGGDHNLLDFNSGYDSLNHWLRKTALKNQTNNASKTWVVCSDGRVVGYYALATGAIERSQAPGAIARQMPDPVPVIVLGRLAVDQAFQGQGLGSALLKHALLRALQVSAHVGVKAVLVHAIDDTARQFYRRYNFKESKIDEYTLMLSIKDIADAFA